jgi:hypothetical protein
MAITDIIEESSMIETGAPSIKYEGERPLKKQEMLMAGPDWYIKRMEILMDEYGYDYDEAGEIAYDSDKYYEVIGIDPSGMGDESRIMDEEVVEEEGIMRAAKGGPVHRHQLAKKRKDGKRPGYYGPDEAHMSDPGTDFGKDTYSAGPIDRGGESGGSEEQFKRAREAVEKRNRQAAENEKIKKEQEKKAKEQEQIKTTLKNQAKKKTDLKKKVDLGLLTDEEDEEQDLMDTELGATGKELSDLKTFDKNKDGKLGLLERLDKKRTEMARKTLTNSAAQKLGMMQKTMVPSFFMSDTMRKTPPGVTTKGLDEILGVKDRDKKTGIGSMEDPFEVDYSMTQYGLGGKDLTRARDQIDVAMQPTISQSEFESVYGNRPGSGPDNEPPQDPCKGPNPPAYCYVGGKNQTDDEEEDDWMLGLAFRKDGGRVGLREGGIPPIANSVQELQPQASQALGSFAPTLGGGLGGQRPVFPRLRELEQGVNRAEGSLNRIRNRLGDDQRQLLAASQPMLLAARPAYSPFLQQIQGADLSNTLRGAGLQNDEERVGRAYGGIMDKYTGRRAYGLGSIFKKVKKVFKSPLGKAAVLGLGAWKAGLFSGLGGGGGFLSGLKNMSLGKKAALTLGGGALAGILAGQEYEDEDGDGYDDKTGLDINKLKSDPYGQLRGRFDYKTGGEAIADLSGDPEYKGWKMMYERNKDVASMHPKHSDFVKYYQNVDRSNKAEGGLMDMGGMEMDLRDEGGFVPIGKKERADDVPARLSKNEFVFTADAVRGAGDGDIDKGAEIMYNSMKKLEAENDQSQGLDGAREMFQVSQRLEEVL